MKLNLYLFLISSLMCAVFSSSSKTKRTCGNNEILKPVMEIVRTYNVEHTIVLIYDEELETGRVHKQFIHDLHSLNRVVVTINLSKSQRTRHQAAFGTSKQSAVLKSFLLMLYNRVKRGLDQHYTFIIWVSNPAILYTYSSGLHPGWKHQDRVILVYPRKSGLLSSDIFEMKFWKHIPYIVALQLDATNSYVNVFTVYPYCGQKTSCYENLDVWSTSDLEFYDGKSQLFLDRFSTFYGANIHAGVIFKEPFLIWGNKLHPYVDGVDWRLIKLIEKKLNATVITVPSEKFGRFENNDWTGMMRNLYNGTIEFALGGVAFTPERSKYFGFSRIYYSDSYTFISPVKTEKPKIRQILMKPFSTHVWFHILGAKVLTAITLFIIANVEKLMAKKLKLKFSKHDEWFTHIKNSAQFVLTQLLQRPCNRFPKSRALTWICNFSSLGFYFLGIVFVTHLIADMSRAHTVASVTKISKIVQSGIPVDIRDYDSELNDYLQSKRPVLWRHANLVNWLESCQSIKRVSRGSRIYVDTRSRLEFYQKFMYNQTRLFSFHLASEDILRDVKIAWAMQKNWPFNKAFDRLLGQAMESGLIHYWVGNFRRGITAWDGENEAMLITENLDFLFDWSSSTTRNGRSKSVNVESTRKYVYEQITMKELDGIKDFFFQGCKLATAILIAEHIWNCFFNVVAIITWLISEFRSFIRRAFRLRSLRYLE